MNIIERIKAKIKEGYKNLKDKEVKLSRISSAYWLGYTDALEELIDELKGENK